MRDQSRDSAIQSLQAASQKSSNLQALSLEKDDRRENAAIWAGIYFKNWGGPFLDSGKRACGVLSTPKQVCLPPPKKNFNILHVRNLTKVYNRRTIKIILFSLKRKWTIQVTCFCNYNWSSPQMNQWRRRWTRIPCLCEQDTVGSSLASPGRGGRVKDTDHRVSQFLL